MSVLVHYFYYIFFQSMFIRSQCLIFSRYDYMEVFDSINYQTRRYCQPGPHDDFVSFGRNIIITFKTDDDGVRSGFKITWTAINENKPQPQITTTTTTTTTEAKDVTVNRNCGMCLLVYVGPYFPRFFIFILLTQNTDCKKSSSLFLISLSLHYSILLFYSISLYC